MTTTEEREEIIVKVPYRPRYWARNNLHYTTKRFITLVIHRRGGKTTASLNHLNRDCLLNKNHRYSYIAPYHKQAKRIAWKMIKDITADIPKIRYNASELTVFYPNGSELILLGGDNPDAIRGIGLNGAILDEYAQMSPLVFTEIITKCIADTLGYVIIIGTPKGKNHFWRIYSTAKTSDRWECIYKTIDNSLEEEEGQTIDNLRVALEQDREMVKDGLMSQEVFDQEWYNSFEATLVGAVYGKQLAKARSDGRITTVKYDAKIPVYTVWDLGGAGKSGDKMSIGFFQRVGREVRLIDYYENTGYGFPHYAKHLRNKPYKYGQHFMPHDIKVAEMGDGKTRFEKAEKIFGENMVDIVPSISFDDGIDSAREMFGRLWIDKDRCHLFEDLIGSYIYEEDEKKGTLKSKPLHDFTSHCADMLRYASIIEDSMDNVDMTKKYQPEPEVLDPEVDNEFTGDLDFEGEDKEIISQDELAKM